MQPSNDNVTRIGIEERPTRGVGWYPWVLTDGSDEWGSAGYWDGSIWQDGAFRVSAFFDRSFKEAAPAAIFARLQLTSTG